MSKQYPFGNHEGVCPLCGGEDLEYLGNTVEGTEICYQWRCSSCGAEGNEWFSMTFEEHTDVQPRSKK